MVDPQFLFEGRGSKQIIWFWEQIQDFHMGRRGGHMIFMLVFKG